MLSRNRRAPLEPSLWSLRCRSVAKKQTSTFLRHSLNQSLINWLILARLRPNRDGIVCKYEKWNGMKCDPPVVCVAGRLIWALQWIWLCRRDWWRRMPPIADRSASQSSTYEWRYCWHLCDSTTRSLATLLGWPRPNTRRAPHQLYNSIDICPIGSRRLSSKCTNNNTNEYNNYCYFI